MFANCVILLPRALGCPWRGCLFIRPFLSCQRPLEWFDRIYPSCNKLAGFDLLCFPSVQMTSIRMDPRSLQGPSVVWLSGMLLVQGEQSQPVLQHQEPGTGETMGSVKHPHLEKSAEKLEKTQKSSVHILRLEQKPWLQRRGKTYYVLPSTPREKQRERGEQRAAVAQVQGAKPTAAQCCAAGTSLPGRELVTTATGLWFWFRQAGKCSGLAGVHGCSLAQSSVPGLHCKELLPTARQGAGEMGDVGCWESTEVGGVSGKTSLLILW